jgi:uncharacterized protein YukE
MSNTNGAQINVRALVEFNKALFSFHGKLNECFSEMDRSIQRLGSDWKDDKYAEFKGEFSQHVQKLKPLADELNRYKDHTETHWIPLIDKFLKNRAQ